MIVGVTGTRKGFTDAQRASFGSLLIFDLAHRLMEFRNGSCQGVNVEAARLVRHIYAHTARIVCHPGPDGDPHRECSGVDDEVLPPKTHFARNRDIVNSSDVIVICPCDMEHQSRGGTWMTHDFAKKVGKPVFVVWPDGSVQRPEKKP